MLKSFSLARALVFTAIVVTALATTTPVTAQTEQRLHAFAGFHNEGHANGYPNGGLIADAAGNLYGTTAALGNPCTTSNCGSVFELSPATGGGYTMTVLHGFTSIGKRPWNPQAGLVMDASGNLYGTTYAGGLSGSGTVFKLSQTGGVWTETVLHNFTGDVPDGAQPASALVIDAAGNLYGVTPTGGAHRAGMVFELSPTIGGGWTYNIIHSFSGADGALPWSPLLIDSLGNLYGSAEGGGGNEEGTIFELSPTTGGAWTASVIYSSSSAPAPLISMDAAGNIYGATGEFGTENVGFVFELTPSGGTWTEQVIYNFCSETHCQGGFGPNGVIPDASGNLYGTTSGGSAFAAGAAYELSPVTGGGWTHTVLHAFGHGVDGAQPTGALLLNAGKLYGSTTFGGTYGYGTVFEITP
jgi:uncharacterized repeat protein (TIGR03803 family)